MSMQSGQAVLQAIAWEWSMEGFSPAIERRGQDSNGSTTITKILVRQADGEQASPKRAAILQYVEHDGVGRIGAVTLDMQAAAIIDEIFRANTAAGTAQG